MLTNQHDLRIWGDDMSSAVNINGMVLYSPDSRSATCRQTQRRESRRGRRQDFRQPLSRQFRDSTSRTSNFLGNEMFKDTVLRRFLPERAYAARPGGYHRDSPQPEHILPAHAREDDRRHPGPCNGACISSDGGFLNHATTVSPSRMWEWRISEAVCVGAGIGYTHGRSIITPGIRMKAIW